MNGARIMRGTTEKPDTRAVRFIRLHPENAAIFFSLAQKYGLGNTKVIVSR